MAAGCAAGAAVSEKSIFVGGPLHGQIRDVPMCTTYSHLMASDPGGINTVRYQRDRWGWSLGPGHPFRSIVVRWTGDKAPDWLAVLDALALAYGFGEVEASGT